MHWLLLIVCLCLPPGISVWADYRNQLLISEFVFIGWVLFLVFFFLSGLLDGVAYKYMGLYLISELELWRSVWSLVNQGPLPELRARDTKTRRGGGIEGRMIDTESVGQSAGGHPS